MSPRPSQWHVVLQTFKGPPVGGCPPDSVSHWGFALHLEPAIGGCPPDNTSHRGPYPPTNSICRGGVPPGRAASGKAPSPGTAQDAGNAPGIPPRPFVLSNDGGCCGAE